MIVFFNDFTHLAKLWTLELQGYTSAGSGLQLNLNLAVVPVRSSHVQRKGGTNLRYVQLPDLS